MLRFRSLLTRYSMIPFVAGVFFMGGCADDPVDGEPENLVDQDAGTMDDVGSDESNAGDPDMSLTDAAVECEPGTERDGAECVTILCGEDERVEGNTCVPCEAGAIRGEGDDASGPDTTCTPIECGEDERVENNSCVACASGTTAAAGAVATEGNTTCTPIVCERDERVDSNTCVPCEAGSTNLAGDTASGPDTMCDGELCPSDTFVQDGVCTPCAAGTTNAAGDDSLGPDTSCEPIICGVDERVEANGCVACPAGTTRPAGDDASGADTICDAIVCGEDERVENNACVGCPAGTTRPAGDDASGSDTTCSPVLCAVDQRVANNACVACPAGEINDAGDDASGPDTMCDPADPCQIALGLTCSDFEEAYVKSSNSEVEDEFGYSVALDGDTLVVGAPQEDSDADGVNGLESDNSATDSGAAYVFRRNGTTWTQEAYLKASNSNGARVVSVSTSTGFTSSFLYGDRFGHSVDIDGDRIVVGAPDESSPSRVSPIDATSTNIAYESGAVYVFERDSNNNWSETAFLKADIPDARDQFGWDVALDGDILVAGAPGDASSGAGVNPGVNDNSVSLSGASYVLSYTSLAGWSQTARIKSPDPRSSDRCGRAVAVSVGTVAVGCEGDDSDGMGGTTATASGVVYIYSGSPLALEATIKPNYIVDFARFGTSVDLDGDLLAVGSPGEDGSSPGVNGDATRQFSNGSGAAYLFRRSGGVWTQEAYVKTLNTFYSANFGYSVGIDNGFLAVGADEDRFGLTGLVPQPTGSGPEREYGAVFLFGQDLTGTWGQLAYIKASNTDEYDRFGASVAIDQTTLAAGAVGESSNAIGVNGNEMDNSAAKSGAVYVRKIQP